MQIKMLLKPYLKFFLITLSGYVFILIGLVVLAFRLSSEVDSFSSQINQLYQHPFQVNAAARIAKQSISTLRADLLYAVIDQNYLKKEEFSEQTNVNQIALNDSLNTIQLNFLGDIAVIEEASSLSVVLEDARNEIINLLADGQITEAEYLIKNHATPLYNALLSRVNYVVEYSSNKAVDLVLQANQKGEESLTKLWLLLSAFAAFTLFAGTVTVTIVLRSLFNRDVTLQEASENLQIAATAFETQEGMMVTDAENRILRVNGAFSKITGYQAEEVIGQNPRILSSKTQDAYFYDKMWSDIHRYGYWEGEVWDYRKSGECFPLKLTITAVKNSDSVVTNYVGTLNDITIQKRAEKEITDLAYYDPLTRLPNRRLLIDRLHHALVTHARSQHIGALLFLDLDQFKVLNDTQGHDTGDLLLKQVAERLLHCVRESDTVARFGGDEFVILIESLSANHYLSANQVEEIANKILSSINAPYYFSNKEHKISTSIGITLFKGNRNAVEELLKQADIALYQAKDNGRNIVRFFDPQMQKSISTQAQLEKELSQAVELHQLELYYQIQMDSCGLPIGAEALLRWNHPTKGTVLPSEFIPLAEQNGFIVSIGYWVINTACAQLSEWKKKHIVSPFTLAINVSAKQFHQEDFVKTIKSALANFDVEPHQLKLELTESILLEDIEKTITKMLELSTLGIQFSLDDFGTGYSSLQYLKRLPLHQLKIDKSFVDGLVEDNFDREIVRTIIVMAHSLGLNVIAEGVESDSQLSCLAKEGCLHYQGYLFGKPESIIDFESRLELSVHA